MPDHELIWTAVGATSLVGDEHHMRVEIEVAAHVPNQK